MGVEAAGDQALAVALLSLHLARSSWHGYRSTAVFCLASLTHFYPRPSRFLAQVPAAAAMLDMLVTRCRRHPPGSDAAAAAGAAAAAKAVAAADAAAAAEVQRFLGRCGAAWDPPPGGVVCLAPGAAPRQLPDEARLLSAFCGPSFSCAGQSRACSER